MLRVKSEKLTLQYTVKDAYNSDHVGGLEDILSCGFRNLHANFNVSPH